MCFSTTMTLVQYPWARLARLSPTMANLGLSLSIPLSASVDAARAPQFVGKRMKKVQVPKMKPEQIGRNDTHTYTYWDFQVDFDSFDRSGFWQGGLTATSFYRHMPLLSFSLQSCHVLLCQV